ncbi:MAG TPA: response regulator transcription factor [Planctomycetota bacterium]|nr:response regulator transcription factor [Planctomycetota bacterium]
MSKKKVLVIEDDADIRNLIRHNLTREGYEVALVENGEEGLRLARKEGFDLAILDLMLPGMHGLDVCRAMREDEKLRATGILIVTAKDEEADIVTGLELGADDYLVKPFTVRVLTARVRAILRRLSDIPSDADDKPMVVGPLKIDIRRHEVTVGTKKIDLTLAEFRILENLAKQLGRVLTRNQLLDIALGQDHFVLDRTIDVHVSALRRKLREASEMIETVRGVGYRLKEKA